MGSGTGMIGITSPSNTSGITCGGNGFLHLGVVVQNYVCSRRTHVCVLSMMHKHQSVTIALLEFQHDWRVQKAKAFV